MRIVVRMRRVWIAPEMLPICHHIYKIFVAKDRKPGEFQHWYWEYHPYLRWPDGYETWLGGRSNRWDIAVLYAQTALHNPRKYARLGYENWKKKPGYNETDPLMRKALE